MLINPNSEREKRRSRRKNRCVDCGRRHGRERKLVVRVPDGYSGPSLDELVGRTPEKVRRFVFVGDPPRVVHRGEMLVTEQVDDEDPFLVRHVYPGSFRDADSGFPLHAYHGCRVRQSDRDLGWLYPVRTDEARVWVPGGVCLANGPYEILELPRTVASIWCLGYEYGSVERQRRLCVSLRGISILSGGAVERRKREGMS